MWYREIIAVCSVIHIKYINTPFEIGVTFLCVKPSDLASNQLVLQCQLGPLILFEIKVKYLSVYNF